MIAELGMAAESQALSQPDVGAESAIKRLLNRQAQLADQQAEVQAQLAALLPTKYGSNIKLELLMLRHKLHALRAYAALHGTPPHLHAICAILPIVRLSSLPSQTIGF